MTAIPERVNRRWIAQLDDVELAHAESELHADFTRQDTAEKARAGTRYRLLEGPATLVHAWNRWLLVSNEARTRGLATNRRA